MFRKPLHQAAMAGFMHVQCVWLLVRKNTYKKGPASDAVSVISVHPCTLSFLLFDCIKSIRAFQEVKDIFIKQNRSTGSLAAVQKSVRTTVVSDKQHAPDENGRYGAERGKDYHFGGELRITVILG